MQLEQVKNFDFTKNGDGNIGKYYYLRDEFGSLFRVASGQTYITGEPEPGTDFQILYYWHPYKRVWCQRCNRYDKNLISNYELCFEVQPGSYTFITRSSQWEKQLWQFLKNY